MDLTNELLKIAKSDLAASGKLYSDRFFSQSYFYFQQSVEKANKALALFSGIITEDDLLSVRHDQIKIYKKVIEKQSKKIAEFEESMKLYPEAFNHEVYRLLRIDSFSEKENDANRFFDSLRNYDLINISLEVIDFYISELNSIKITEINNIDRIEEILGPSILKYADWVGSFGTDHSLLLKSEILSWFESNENRDEYYTAVKDSFKYMKDLAFLFATLYFFSLLTIQHSSMTRYVTNGINPIDLYTKDLPIVQRQPILLVILDDALARLEEIVNRK